LVVHDIAGRKERPGFYDENGFLMRNNTMNEMLWEVIEKIYEASPALFPKAIDCIERIRQLMNISRTMRRTSASQMTRMGVSELDRDVVNHWLETQKAMQNGKKPNQHLSICIMLNKNFCVITSGATLRLFSYLVDAALNDRGGFSRVKEDKAIAQGRPCLLCVFNFGITIRIDGLSLKDIGRMS